MSRNPLVSRPKVVATSALLLLGLVVAPMLSPQRADASHPQVVADAIAHLLTLHTVYSGLGLYGVLQVDVTQEVITYDSPEARVHWDGTKLWIHQEGEPAPAELPSEWAARVRQVWDEWRGGFANTTFTVESPSTFDPDVHDWPARPWYRVTLPFGWTSDYRIYAQVLSNGRLGLFSVYDGTSLEPVSLGTRWEGREEVTALVRNAFVSTGSADVDVPLSPETYSPVRPARQPTSGAWRPGSKPGPHGEWSGGPAWHQRQQFVDLVRVDTNGGGLTAGPQLAHRCESASTVYTEPLSVRFAFPEDPEKADLARQATTDCPNAAYHSKLTVFHDAAAGARTCAVGQWEIVNTLPEPDVTLWTRQIQECRTGPDEARLDFPTNLPLPVGSDPTGIEVRFAGLVRIECTAVGAPDLTGMNHVLAGFEPEHQPTLAWPGCYPGWVP